MTTIADAIYDLLLRQGPCTEEQVHQHLLTTGRSSARTTAGARSSLASHPWAHALPDGRWDTIARPLRGAVLTTRPRSQVRDGVLWVHRDLEPFDALHTSEGIPLAAGGFALRGRSGIATLVGPHGWLPTVKLGDLIALTWDGHALSVSLTHEILAGDSEQVRRVRLLLRSHAEALVGWNAPYLDQRRFFSRVTLSALQEDPDLLRQPLPPLSELLPLPEHLLPIGAVSEAPGDGVPLTLSLPSRVFHELERRAEVLGDQLPGYAGMLLGAAVDRVLPPVRRADCGCRYVTGYNDRDDDSYSWVTDEAESVIRPARWGG